MFIRRLACSVLFLPLIPPFLCLLWFILPSQEPASDTIISEIVDGYPVARAYESYKYFKDRTYNDLHDYTALIFQYDGSSLAINDQKIPLGSAVSDFPRAIEINHVAAGVVDGINLPWFNRADACLLSALTGRLQSPDNDGPQLSLEIHRNEENSHIVLTVVPATRTGADSHLWLLSMTLNRPLTKSLNSTNIPTFSFPEGSSSPSNTYRIRKQVLIILATLYFNFRLLGALIWLVVKLITALGIVVGCIWLCGQNFAEKKTPTHDKERGEITQVHPHRASADKGPATETKGDYPK